MRLEPGDRAEPFIPAIGPGAQRSALPDDWLEAERAFLAQAYLEITHPMLRARLADLAWHIAKSRLPGTAGWRMAESAGLGRYSLP